tara:strand:+ start:6108 stop:7538 length:1431 start_codon:yes stop_codon:yes gene_type:complete
MNIKQKPLYKLIPAGEKIIFTVRDNTAITNVKSKYIAKVYISEFASTIMTTSTTAIVKVNPNVEGVGIFDLSTVLENYVSPDFFGGGVGPAGTSNTSSYKGVDHTEETPHEIHLIDEWACNQNSVRYFCVEFYTEYADSISDPVVVDESMKIRTENFLIFNGILDHNDVLNYVGNDFGYNLDGVGLIPNEAADSFLTNSPVKQYVRENDYMTFAMFNNLTPSNSSFELAPSGSFNCVSRITFQFYYNGSTTGSALNYSNTTGAGGYQGGNLHSDNHIIYRGVGPANIKNSGVTLPTNWDYYTVRIYDSTGGAIAKEYALHKQSEDCKGYETIRLCWVNKWGTWDYYNFTKKSVRTLDKAPSTYHQNYGTWNQKTYREFGHTGGTKVVKNMSVESIQINTDWLTETEAIWLEELFLSNDVYILQEDSSDVAMGFGRKYVEPVVIKTSAHIRKTKANDRLIQYSLDIEKSKPKRSHRA